jgi:hypothetical protein
VAWRKLFGFTAHQALFEQHREATKGWVWVYNRLILLLSAVATVLGVVALSVFPNADPDKVGSDDETIFDSAAVGSLRWCWSLGMTLVALAATALSARLTQYTHCADQTLEECDVAIGQYEKLIAMYLKTLKAPVSKRQEHLDFTAASDAIEAEKPIATLSSYDFYTAAHRVKENNAPVWRKYFRYIVVDEERGCCGLNGGLLGSSFNSFEFPQSRIVGICLMYKVSEETLGRHLESPESGEGSRRAFDVFFAHELGQQPVAKYPGKGEAFVDPFCEPLRGLVAGADGLRPQFTLSMTLCNEVLERFLESKSRFVRGSTRASDVSRGPVGAPVPPSPFSKHAQSFAMSQSADIPTPASYAV